LTNSFFIFEVNGTSRLFWALVRRTSLTPSHGAWQVQVPMTKLQPAPVILKFVTRI